MEFLITNEHALPKAIDFDFERYKTALKEKVDIYKSIIVTEDSIKAAKDERAELNKFRASIDSERKRIKKIWTAPVTEFEGKVKELLALIDEPISVIDSQLKEFEDKRKAEKREEVEALYTELIGDMADILPLQKIWDERWLNAGSKLNAIKKDITDIIEKVNENLNVLDTVESEFSVIVKAKYLETLDLASALNEKAKLQQQAELIREKEAVEAEKKERYEGSAIAPEPIYTPAPKPKYQPPEVVFNAENHTYRVNGKLLTCISDVIRFLNREVYDGIDAQTLSIAADRGTRVHEACEQLYKNGMAEADDDTAPYIDAFSKFLTDHKCEFTDIEVPLADPVTGIAGTPDLCGTVDGEEAIVDMKAQGVIKKILVKAQVNGYRHLRIVNGKKPPTKLYCLQLMNDGNYRLYPIALDYSEFNACLTLHNAMQREQERGSIK